MLLNIIFAICKFYCKSKIVGKTFFFRKHKMSAVFRFHQVSRMDDLNHTKSLLTLIISSPKPLLFFSSVNMNNNKLRLKLFKKRVCYLHNCVQFSHGDLLCAIYSQRHLLLMLKWEKTNVFTSYRFRLKISEKVFT